MAKIMLTATVGTALTPVIGNSAELLGQTATVKADVAAIVYTTFAADLATLVADGATPTQAHVTAVNNDWTALKALIDTAVTDAAKLPATNSDVMLQVNGSNVLTYNKYDEIMNAFRRRMTGILTGNFDNRSVS